MHVLDRLFVIIANLISFTTNIKFMSITETHSISCKIVIIEGTIFHDCFKLLNFLHYKLRIIYWIFLFEAVECNQVCRYADCQMYKHSIEFLVCFHSISIYYSGVNSGYYTVKCYDKFSSNNLNPVFKHAMQFPVVNDINEVDERVNDVANL